MPMPTTSAECAPHQPRKAAERVRRIIISITVSASHTNACDTTVGASEDAPPLPPPPVAEPPPQQERHHWPARRPRPYHWSSRNRRGGPAITSATRKSARDGDRTQAIRYLASEAGTVDRPRGVLVAVTHATPRLAALCSVCQFALVMYLNVLLCRFRDIGRSIG